MRACGPSGVLQDCAEDGGLQADNGPRADDGLRADGGPRAGNGLRADNVLRTELRRRRIARWRTAGIVVAMHHTDGA